MSSSANVEVVLMFAVLSRHVSILAVAKHKVQLRLMGMFIITWRPFFSDVTLRAGSSQSDKLLLITTVKQQLMLAYVSCALLIIENLISVFPLVSNS